MTKNVEEKEVYIDEFRKKVDNEHFLYENGEWVKINLSSDSSSI